MTNEGLGRRIKEVRTNLGLTMKEFGDLLTPPASDSLVSRWERGVNSPNRERLKQIAEKSDITVHYLTTGEKTLADLSEKERNEVAHSVSDMFYSIFDKQGKYTIKEFKSIADNYDDLTYKAQSFYNNAIKFVKTSDEKDISFFSALMSQIINMDIKQGNMSQKEIKRLVEADSKAFKEFIKTRYGLKENEKSD